MAFNSIVPSAAAAAAADGGPPTPTPLPSPTTTHYQQLAEEFKRSMDSLSAIIPRLEPSHVSTANFVRTHMNVSLAFLATTVAAVEQVPELQAVGKLDPVAARDTLQFIEAFRPVLDRVAAFAATLQFTLKARRAALAADSLQVYDIAKGLARDPGGAHVASFVANMKRDLGRRGKKLQKPGDEPSPDGGATQKGGTAEPKPQK